MNIPTPAQSAEPENQNQSFFGVIIHSFFIIPFLIAVFCVLLFAAVKLLTAEHKTVYGLLEDVKTGGITRRWQGAFELSKILAEPKLIPQEARFAAELSAAFRNSDRDDDRVRQYLALAMGRTENPEFFPVLTEKIAAEKEENLYAIIYALGMLKDARAVPVLQQFIDHHSAKLRSMTVVSLGTIDDSSAKEILKKTLTDPEPNVQWGSAVSLAQMGDPSGKGILLKLLDRDYLKTFPEVDPQEQNQLILTAIAAAAKIPGPELVTTIQKLASADANLKIRAAAMEFVAASGQTAGTP